MKFVSKNSNYRLVLRPGIQAEPLAGRAAIPGIYVRFEDGVANIDDPKIIEALKAHPKFDVDFVAVSEENEAAMLAGRSSSEPEHSIMNVQFGHVGKEENPKKKLPLSPELKKALAEMAVPIAQEMAKTMLKQMLEAQDAAKSTPSKTKAKNKTTAKTVAAEEPSIEETEPIENSK